MAELAKSDATSERFEHLIQVLGGTRSENIGSLKIIPVILGPLGYRCSNTLGHLALEKSRVLDLCNNRHSMRVGAKRCFDENQVPRHRTSARKTPTQCASTPPPSTLNPQPHTLNHRAETQNPKDETSSLNPKP